MAKKLAGRSGSRIDFSCTVFHKSILQTVTIYRYKFSKNEQVTEEMESYTNLGMRTYRMIEKHSAAHTGSLVCLEPIFVEPSKAERPK